MNLKNKPKIIANKSNNNNSLRKISFHERPEKLFKTKQELQAYLVDSVFKNKRKSFNMNVVLT